MKNFFWAGLLSLSFLSCGEKPAKVPEKSKESPPVLVKTTVKPVEVPREEVLWRHLNVLTINEAQLSDKLMVFVFSSKTCGPCKELQRVTLQDPEVVRLLNEGFIPVLLEGEGYLSVFEEFEIEPRWPTIALLDAEGNLLVNFSGYVSPVAFRDMLTKVLEVRNNPPDRKLEHLTRDPDLRDHQYEPQ